MRCRITGSSIKCLCTYIQYAAFRVCQKAKFRTFSPAAGNGVTFRSRPLYLREKRDRKNIPHCVRDRMSDAHKGKRGEKAIQRAPSPLSPSIYDNEIPLGSPVSKPAVASPLTRIRFLPRELPDGVRSPSAMSSATMETHILDVESPGATLERKVTKTKSVRWILSFWRERKRREGNMHKYYNNVYM